MDNEQQTTIDPDVLAWYADLEQSWRDREPQPGTVFTKRVNGRIIPIHHLACPMYQQGDDQPECMGTEEEGTCCGEFFGFNQGHVLCSGLRSNQNAQKVDA